MMHDFKSIRFAYFPAEAEMPVVAWCLKQLDAKLTELGAGLVINDIKFGRAGMEISWYLTHSSSEELENQLEQEIEWICRKASSDL